MKVYASLLAWVNFIMERRLLQISDFAIRNYSGCETDVLKAKLGLVFSTLEEEV